MADQRHPERRAAALELRARGRRLEGYAALFEQETRIGDFREIIKRGAFRRALAEKPDILALVDHDPKALLGRTASGTLRLAANSTGLQFEIDLPQTTLARDLLELADRGDLGGMSFGFTVNRQRWNNDLRELIDLNLVEISVVHSWPAYEGTTVTARSKPRADDRARRLKLLEIGR